MNFENLTLVPICEMEYTLQEQSLHNDGLYLELKLKRDRSSFAGVGFKVLKKTNLLICPDKFDEYTLQEVNKYDRILLGGEQDYLESMKNTFYSLGEKCYGLEILFLTYSDVRSSPKIFEDLMISLHENIEDIQKTLI